MSKKPTKNNRYKRITCEGYCKFEEYIAEWLIIRWTDEFKICLLYTSDAADD